MVRFRFALFCAVCLGGCDGMNEKGGEKKSYAFGAEATVSIGGSGLNVVGTTSTRLLQSTLCTEDQPNLTCVAPSALTGIYYGLGLLIQAGGSGLQGYLLNDTWSDIDASTPSFAFDAASPSPTTGTLSCCGGQGDLTGGNVYFSNVSFVFGYLDATFKVPYSTAQQSTVSATMNAAHTVRFVLTDEALAGYKRGDLLYKDTDGTFKWCDSSGTLTQTRPSSPITMNSKVVNWTNPFEGGAEDIPVIYTAVNDQDGGKVTTSEDALKDPGKTYQFDFDTTYFVAIMKGRGDLSTLQTVKDLLGAMHLQGLPHTDFTFGTSGTSTLKIID